MKIQIWCTGSEAAGRLAHTFVTERPARSRLDDVSNIIETPAEETKDDAEDDSVFAVETIRKEDNI